MMKARSGALLFLPMIALWTVAGCGDDNDNTTKPTPRTVFHAASYCETGGFAFASHTDEFIHILHINCYQGIAFSDSISKFTASGTDVIFIGGDNSFSEEVAGAISTAVYKGKILVINFWSNRAFGDCLPATNEGGAFYGSYLTVVNPDNPIFEGLPTQINRTGGEYGREHATAKAGATVLMTYDNGDPALLYWKYGRGYVIEWTFELFGVWGFPAGGADLITYRTIKHCIDLQGW